MKAEEYARRAEELLEAECHVMDYLPEPVPPDSRGNFFNVEAYLLNSFDRFGLCERITAALLKLLCYRRAVVRWDGWKENPEPRLVADAVRDIMANHSGMLYILLPEDDALVTFEWDCLYISVYNAAEPLSSLIESIARSENLTWRRGTN